MYGRDRLAFERARLGDARGRRDSVYTRRRRGRERQGFRPHDGCTRHRARYRPVYETMPVFDAFIQQLPGILVGAATAGSAFLVRRRIERRREVDSLDIEKRTAELHAFLKEKGLTLEDLAALRATVTSGVPGTAGPFRNLAPLDQSLDVDEFIRDHLYPRWFQWMQGFFAVYWGLTLAAAIVEDKPLTAQSGAVLCLYVALLLVSIRDLVEILGWRLGRTELIQRVVRKRLLPHLRQADVRSGAPRDAQTAVTKSSPPT